MGGRRAEQCRGAVRGVDNGCRGWQQCHSVDLLVVAAMITTITLRALWWAIKAHRGQQWPEGRFTRSQVERGEVPYGTVIVFG